MKRKITNDYTNRFTGERLSVYPSECAGFIKGRNRTTNTEKLEKQRENFLKRYTCPICGQPKTWIEGTNLMVCKNESCPGIPVKNKDGEIGFILIDYKTSSRTPDWDDYLDQIYRYIFLLESEFPGVPVLKIGIINARKASIKIKKNENNESFLHRLKLEYDINDNNYICYHIFDPAELDRTLLDNYIDNLSRMADMADNIDTNKLFFINYKNAKNQYGKSPYYDIFYGVPDCYMLYKIKDTIWDEDDNIITKERDCLPLDMQVINHTNVLNHYSKFKNAIDGSLNKSEMNKKLKSMFITDESLLEKYWCTYDNENKLK